MSHGTDAVGISTIGIDTGKNTLHLVGLNDEGTIVLREKLGRGRIRTRLANVPRCVIGIEAGMATHYLARELIVLGHDVRQVPPVYARPIMMRPQRCASSVGSTARVIRKAATRLTSMTRRNSSDVASHSFPTG
jgi:transposase